MQKRIQTLRFSMIEQEGFSFDFAVILIKTSKFIRTLLLGIPTGDRNLPIIIQKIFNFNNIFLKMGFFLSFQGCRVFPCLSFNDSVVGGLLYPASLKAKGKESVVKTEALSSKQKHVRRV